MSGDFPSVPEDRLAADGWTLQRRDEETVFRLPGVTVTGHTLVYDDGRLRESMANAGVEGAFPDADGDSVDLLGGPDGDVWRFFFASALSVRPPLPPGIGPSLLSSTVSTRARTSLESDLRARGFERIAWDERQRFRTDSGDRGQLWRFTARLPTLDADQLREGLEIEGWLAVWTTDGSFRIAGGAYPSGGLEPVSEASPADPRRFRAELLELIRSVA